MGKILKRLNTKEILMILICVVFIVGQVWLDLRLPDYMSEITTLVQTPESKMSEILSVGGWMLLCALGSFVASVVVGYFAAQIASSFSARLREDLFYKVESFSMAEINQFSTPSLITRSTNDVTQLRMLISMGLQLIIKAPIMAVWAITKISSKSWQWTVIVAAAVLLLFVLIGTIILLAMPKFKKMQTLTDKLNSVTRENLLGLRVVRAYNAESYQENKFEEASQAVSGTQRFTGRVMAIMQPGMQIISNGLTLGVYWIGAFLINQAVGMDKVTVFSDMVVFSSYAMQVVMSFMMLTAIFIMWPRASVSATRINEALDMEPSITDGPLAIAPTDVKGGVEFQNVSFKYPDAADYVLKDISFTANSGETVAFIGATGSGKSTLVDLIPRFYDATEGEVLVDGINVKEYTQEALHNKLGYVSQKAVLFSGTVASNVAYGDNGRGETTEEGVKRAVEIAQAKEFVEGMPGEYNAPIARGGTNVSGGQKQRLSIARAVARDPEIYIFDDSFSALDYKTDRKLRSVLNEEVSEATRLIVAQRIGTIMDADKIIVLDEGEIVGMGTHEELMENNTVYQEIAYSQLSEEELKHGE
ncbi:MAG: ABC transporter ATP-binding protein [Christensenellaceae bacterium]|jgi:ATP-binding cassette subfamily B multidrug efflux pump